MSTLFNAVLLAPRDPILGITEQFNMDPRPNKVHLGVGVYYNDKGKVPLLDAVRQAEADYNEAAVARSYLPIEGSADYNRATQALLLGPNSSLITEGRALTVQSLGGTGALKIGADFLYQLRPNAKVYISDPSWENHRALFERAGFEVLTYPYYDPVTKGLNFEGMLAKLNTLPADSIVVLHPCCHNPTGIDPNFGQWQQIAQVIQEKGLIPFLDIAYQGFDVDLEKDAAVVRLFASQDMPVFISSSFSKSFSLYGERVGTLTLIAQTTDQAARILSQLKRIIRTNYSNPPTHGSAIVTKVLKTPELRDCWKKELASMRNRIHLMRQQLVEKIKQAGATQDFSAVLNQRGMFSYSGLTAAQVTQLRDEYAIYAVSSGRICVAALNSNNIDYVAKSIAAVIQTT